jgi:cyclase
MKKKRLIPVLLLKDGWIVQSHKFQNYKQLGNPITSVKRLSEWCSDELIYLDISKEENYDFKRNDQNYHNKNSFLEIISDVAKIAFMPLTVGGKIKTIKDIENIIRRGGDKVCINTAALNCASFVKDAVKEFGSQCIVISIDAKKIDNKYYVFNTKLMKNTNKELVDWVKKMEDFGAGEIFLNSIDRDGTGIGFDIELANMVKKNSKIPLIFCGGAGNKEDFSKLIMETDIDAIAAANIFHFSDQSLYYIKKHLYEADLNFREPKIFEL